MKIKLSELKTIVHRVRESHEKEWENPADQRADMSAREDLEDKVIDLGQQLLDALEGLGDYVNYDKMSELLNDLEGTYLTRDDDAAKARGSKRTPF